MVDVDVKSEDISAFRAILFKRFSLKDPNSIDLIPARDLKNLFADAKFRSSIHKTGMTTLYQKFQKAIHARYPGENRHGAVVPSMIYAFGYNPNTGALLSAEAEAEKITVQPEPRRGPAAAPAAELTPTVPILSYIGDYLKTFSNAISLNCGNLVPAGIMAAVGTQKVGKSLVLINSSPFDAIFTDALVNGMGYCVELDAPKIPLQASDKSIATSALLIITREKISDCAYEIEFQNGLNPSSAFYNAILDLANRAQTQSEVDAAVSLLDDVIKILKEQPEGRRYFTPKELADVENLLLAAVSQVHEDKPKDTALPEKNPVDNHAEKMKIMKAILVGTNRVSAHIDSLAIRGTKPVAVAPAKRQA